MPFCVGLARFDAAVIRVVWACLLWCCVAATVGACARAQTAVDGAIGGFVVDASGAALVGAVVQVENVANGATIRATTVTKGEFLMANLPAGEYRGEVEYAL